LKVIIRTMRIAVFFGVILALQACVSPVAMVEKTVNAVEKSVTKVAGNSGGLATSTEYKIQNTLNTNATDVSEAIYAQLNIADKNELETNQYPGYIVDLDGNTIQGVVWLKGNERNPWDNQKSVRFVSIEQFNAAPLGKRDWVKYKPKNLKAYGLFNWHFKSESHSDKSSLGTGMIPKRYFLKEITSGKVDLYALYNDPPLIKITTSEAERQAYERELQNRRVNPRVLVRNAKGKLSNPTDINISAMLADCPEVLEKYNNGAYGFTPRDNGSKSGIKKFVGRVLDANNASAGGRLVPIFVDYNECTAN